MLSARVRAPANLARLLLMAAATIACGAKTGLNVPEIMDATDAVADVQPDSPPICIDPNDAGRPFTVELTLNAQIIVADVLFLIDRTGSMDQEIDNIRNGLRTIIVPGLARSIPDLQLGIVTYADFNIAPYGSTEDVPFTLVTRMTSEIAAVQGAINNVRVGFGGDNPEAMAEALYQTATGEGLRSLNGTRDLIGRSGGCPGPGVGYPCFRTGAQPIIVLVADAPSHNGVARPAGWRCVPPTPITGVVNSYNPSDFAGYQNPHTMAQAIEATRRVRARVMGINSGSFPIWGREDLEQLACETGAVGDDGQPLVFDVGADGSGLDQQVVTAIRRFQAEVRFDVSARAVDADGGNGADLIRSIRATGASPRSGIRSMNPTTFFGVLPGTRLSFAVEIDPARAMPTDREQRFRIRIEFLGDGRPNLGSRELLIVIPARGMPVCPAN